MRRLSGSDAYGGYEEWPSAELIRQRFKDSVSSGISKGLMNTIRLQTPALTLSASSLQRNGDTQKLLPQSYTTTHDQGSMSLRTTPSSWNTSKRAAVCVDDLSDRDNDETRLNDIKSNQKWSKPSGDPSEVRHKHDPFRTTTYRKQNSFARQLAASSEPHRDMSGSMHRKTILFWYPNERCLDAIAVRKCDQDRLSDGVYLNDILIDLFIRRYYEDVVKQHPIKAPSDLHVFSSHFFTRIDHGLRRTPLGLRLQNDVMLMRRDAYNRVKSWTKRVDIFSKRVLICPLNKARHWSLALIHLTPEEDPARPPAVSIFTLDSLGSYHDPQHTKEVLGLFLNYEWAARSRALNSGKQWPRPMRSVRRAMSKDGVNPIERQMRDVDQDSWCSEGSDDVVEIVEGPSSLHSLTQGTPFQTAMISLSKSLKKFSKTSLLRQSTSRYNLMHITVGYTCSIMFKSFWINMEYTSKPVTETC